MHRAKKIYVDAPTPTTSLSPYFLGCHLQYKLFRTMSGSMDTQSAMFLFLKENVCSGYLLEAALSNVNGKL